MVYRPITPVKFITSIKMFRITATNKRAKPSFKLEKPSVFWGK